MFEIQTYETILKRALARVPNDVDKRQGSIIWDALAPACVELTQMYIELDNLLQLTFAETSYGQWLEKRTSEMGIHRESATKAIRLGLFYDGNKNLMNIPLESRFNIEDLNYIAVKKISTGQYEMECEEVGIYGNQLYGSMIPIDNINKLGRAELADVLVPGEDEEQDATLYARYEEAVNTTPYGGNIADYKRKVKAMEGVGDCKVSQSRCHHALSH